MAYPKPPVGKGAVKQASKAVFEGAETQQDVDAINECRASHGYVINNFQAWNKEHVKKTGVKVEFAQRLKRHNPVLDKLRRTRPDGPPIATDLTSMQDLAGCRVIF